MANVTDSVAIEVADIIRRVGKRDEILDNVAENVDFSKLVEEQLKVEGPVKEAAIKAVLGYIKDLEIDSESDTATEILESIDFKEFVPTILKSKEFQDVLADAVESSIENGNVDISSSLEGVLDSKEIEKLLADESVRKIIVQKYKAYVEEYDMSELDDDAKDKLDKVLFSTTRIEQALKENTEDLNDLVNKKVTDYLESFDDDADSSPIATAITESKAFQSAVDKAVDDLIGSGKVDRLVEKVATSMLSGDQSSLREKLTNAVSDKLVGKIAGAIVDRALKV